MITIAEYCHAQGCCIYCAYPKPEVTYFHVKKPYGKAYAEFHCVQCQKRFQVTYTVSSFGKIKNEQRR